MISIVHDSFTKRRTPEEAGDVGFWEYLPDGRYNASRIVVMVYAAQLVDIIQTILWNNIFAVQ